jgi:replication-associated recombination protein RarA
MLAEDTQQQCLMPLTIANQNKELAVIPKTSKGSQKQTQRGYDFHELLSALQKDIRRGNEYEAMFWAAELESFNPTALWNRLKVIASEDVGCANPLMPILIETLRRQYVENKQKVDNKD